MPEYVWDEAKNECLRLNRGLSFDDVVYHINHGGLLDDIQHPNQHLHPEQRLYVVLIDDCVYLVPFSALEILNH